jgi:GNAT superfamily N-acetyltransferase
MPDPIDNRSFSLTLRAARAEDVKQVRAILSAAAADLSARFGEGHWSGVRSTDALQKYLAEGDLYIAEIDAVAVGTLRLTCRKIGFYRSDWFANPKDAAGYLLDMAIDPARQRCGVGRRSLALAEDLARSRGLMAIRLDAYGGPAGAGEFYRKCGYRLAHVGTFNGVALEYFEKRVEPR